MPRSLILLAPLVCLSCSMNMKRAALPHARPIPSTVMSTEESGEARESGRESEREDSYREAAEFYLLKRVAPGSDLPVERYLEGKRHASAMPQYSFARR